MSQPGVEINRPRSLVPKMGMGDERKSLGEVQELRPRWEGHALVECNYCCFLGGFDPTTLDCCDLVLAAGILARWTRAVGHWDRSTPLCRAG